MKGQNFLKVTGILMIIASILSILVGVVIGGIGALAAGIGAGSSLTVSYFLVLILTLAGGIVELIAGIIGVKHCNSSENAKKCIVWGGVVVILGLLSTILNLAGGNKFDFVSFVSSLIVPGLYIYGAVLNSKADSTRSAA